MFKYTAIIIEPREHKALEFVLENFFTNLSDEWGFIIFHGIQNEKYIQKLFATTLSKYSGRIERMIKLNTDNLTPLQYSNICKSIAFYKCISTEIFLMFQTDSMILNPDLLNNFLEYDYVGAPWENGIVGNGGLSLRRKSKMIEICQKVDSKFAEYEDAYFSYQNIVPLNKPPFREALQFSIETVFHEKSFGVHNTWRYLNEYELESLIHRYPDLEKLIELNN